MNLEKMPEERNNCISSKQLLPKNNLFLEMDVPDEVFRHFAFWGALLVFKGIGLLKSSLNDDIFA